MEDDISAAIARLTDRIRECRKDNHPVLRHLPYAAPADFAALADRRMRIRHDLMGRCQYALGLLDDGARLDALEDTMLTPDDIDVLAFFLSAACQELSVRSVKCLPPPQHTTGHKPSVAQRTRARRHVA